MTELRPPEIAGLHHVTLPVRDLDVSCTWFERVVGARRNARLDYQDDYGRRFAIVLEVPGLGTLLQLRLGTDMSTSPHGFQPLTFQVEGMAHLLRWIEHLDAASVANSGVELRNSGYSVTFTSPDGTELRFQTRPDVASELASIT
jgi:catechol 2,3-dioxygenase-like lactoylglutathione lyase family enzyme